MSDDLAPLGDERRRRGARTRGDPNLTEECIDVTRERLRRGERPNLNAVARGAVVGMRNVLIDPGLPLKQREAFLCLAAAEILRADLQNLERTATKRRVN